MGLFSGGGLFSGPFGGDLFDRGPSISDKLEMLFKDVETEGKKQGYMRAAEEYGKAFKAVENEFKETKELIENQKYSHDAKVEVLISRLEIMEKQKAELEKQVERKTKDVSTKYNVPMGDVTKSLVAGTLVCIGPENIDILGLIYNHKEKKLKEAEGRGYAEAKELYLEKIANLKKDLLDLKKKGSKEVRELLMLINDLFDSISKEQMKIAELKILL